MPIYFFRSMGVSCSERSSKCNFDSRLKNPTNRGILWAILVNRLCAPKLAHGPSPLPPSSLQKSNPRGAAQWNLGDKSADSAETKPSTGHQAELRRVTNSRTIYRQLQIPRYRYRPKTNRQDCLELSVSPLEFHRGFVSKKVNCKNPEPIHDTWAPETYRL